MLFDVCLLIACLLARSLVVSLFLDVALEAITANNSSWNNKSSFVRFIVHMLAYLLFARAFIVPTRNSTYALNAV